MYVVAHRKAAVKLKPNKSSVIEHSPISMFLKASNVADLLTITLSSVFGKTDLSLFIFATANLKAVS